MLQSRAVIACSWQRHKLMLATLPAAAVPDDDAPVALMVSGEGLRQGLVQGPRALAVAPDGRILVLESLNRRVQAFDSRGNPVPSFTPAGAIAEVTTTTVEADLDAGRVPQALQTALQDAGATYRCTIPASFADQLDRGRFTAGDDLLATLAADGITLAYDPDAMQDPALSAQITLVEPGRSWVLTDPRGQQWQVRTGGDGLDVFARITAAQVQVEQSGRQWLIVDSLGGGAWRLAPATADPGTTQIRTALSFFPLRGMRERDVTYLDLAVEAQGYVYVLAYQNDGSAPTDYLLDVYGPDGRLVLRTPDPSVTATPQNVVAGKLAVDLFRNVYALTYQTLLSPAGTPQPGLAHWVPTPPLFALPLSQQPDLNSQNIAAVHNDFAAHGVSLSTAAFVSVDDPEGAWTVRDGLTCYHVYRSGGGLQVYPVPA